MPALFLTVFQYRHCCQLDSYLHFDPKLLLVQLQRMVEEEELQFHEDYMNEQDPSILHFLLASGDDVCCYSYVEVSVAYLMDLSILMGV